MTNYIVVRWPNDDTGSDFRVPGILVNNNVAVVLLDEHIEIHLVEITANPNEYELRYASNPLFYVGRDWPTIFTNLTMLSLAEFASKYTHSEFQDLNTVLHHQ